MALMWKKRLQFVCLSGLPQTPNGSLPTPKLNSAVNDEQSRMGDKKPFVDSAELVMCQTFSQCASFPCSVQLSLSPTGKPNEGAERTENVIVGGEQSLELKNTVSS